MIATLNRDALVAAIRAEPKEILHRYALADWCEETGVPFCRKLLCEGVKVTMKTWLAEGPRIVAGLPCGMPLLQVEITDREPFGSEHQDGSGGYAFGRSYQGRGVNVRSWCWFLPSESRSEGWAEKAVLPQFVFSLLAGGTLESQRAIYRYVLADGYSEDAIAALQQAALDDLNCAALLWAEAIVSARNDPKQVASPREILQ